MFMLWGGRNAVYTSAPPSERECDQESGESYGRDPRMLDGQDLHDVDLLDGDGEGEPPTAVLPLHGTSPLHFSKHKNVHKINRLCVSVPQKIGRDWGGEREKNKIK